MVLYKKKQKNVDEGNEERDGEGDCWIYIAKKPDTKLHLAHSTGKRVQETADKLMEAIRRRSKIPTKKEKATFTSDGNDQYTNALLKNFEEDTINYGQLIKERGDGRIVSKTRVIIFGNVNEGDMETVYIERYNLTLRHGISRLVRKSLCFSKCKEMLDNHLDVYQCYNNLIRINSALTIKTKKGERDIERTPCMAENITDHIWDWNELLRFRICHEN